MFIVLEIQEPDYGEMPQVITYIRETKTEAMATYYSILSQAAVSTYYRHTAMVITTDGKYLACESYDHALDRSEE